MSTKSHNKDPSDKQQIKISSPAVYYKKKIETEQYLKLDNLKHNKIIFTAASSSSPPPPQTTTTDKQQCQHNKNS